MNTGKNRGFALLEVLIAVGLLTVGGFAVIRAVQAGFMAHAMNEKIDLALNIAQSRMEEARVNLVTSVGAPDPVFPMFQVAVDVDGSTNPRRVDVTVSWNDKGAQDQVVLTTFAANLT